MSEKNSVDLSDVWQLRFPDQLFDASLVVHSAESYSRHVQNLIVVSAVCGSLFGFLAALLFAFVVMYGAK